MTAQARVARCVVATAMEGIRQRDSMHYAHPGVPSESKLRWDGIKYRVLGPHQPLWSDCSSWATWLVWQARVRIRGSAGADIMNETNWSWGWTGSLIHHGKRHTFRTRKFWTPGMTLVFYGKPSVTHVAIFVGRKNGVEMVASHGSEGGPYYAPWNYRDDFHMARRYSI